MLEAWSNPLNPDRRSIQIRTCFICTELLNLFRIPAEPFFPRPEQVLPLFSFYVNSYPTKVEQAPCKNFQLHSNAFFICTLPIVCNAALTNTNNHSYLSKLSAASPPNATTSLSLYTSFKRLTLPIEFNNTFNVGKREVRVFLKPKLQLSKRLRLNIFQRKSQRPWSLTNFCKSCRQNWRTM